MKDGLLTGIVWLALVVAALALAYLVASVIIWGLQRLFIAVWPAVSQRPSVAGAVILSLVVLLGIIDRQERTR
jgi:hypothetical protein